MNILVTNDDGWGAPGIQQLARLAKELGDVTVIAPSMPQSGISHQLTLDRSMTLIEQGTSSFSLAGTPADCVRYGLNHLGQAFDLVLSGINDGANLGVDVFVSGTVAAAREATFHGVSSIALSQYRTNMSAADFDWARSASWCQKVLANVVPMVMYGSRDEIASSQKSFNVNLPDGVGEQFPKMVYCATDRLPLPTEYSKKGDQVQFAGRYQDRLRTSGRDVDVCFSGQIAISEIN